MSADSEPLLPRVAAGDADAMRLCIERYGPLVWGLARRFLGGSSDAEDAVQDIFIELWRSAERFRAEVASEKTFVAMIARRRLIDRRRALGRKPATVDSGELQLGLDPPSEDAPTIRRMLGKLRDEQRQVLLMSACFGMSHGEIAEHSGMALGTVKSHARRGLMQLRSLMGGGEGAT